MRNKMGLRRIWRKPILFLAVLPMFMASLACSVTVHIPPLHPSATSIATATAYLPASFPTQTARPTDSPTPRPSTPTLLPAPSPTLRPTASSKQLAVLSELWNAVHDNYLYEDFNGLDWEAIYQEYHERVEAGMSDAEFYLAMDEMVRRLGDDHSTFFSPEQAKLEENNFTGAYQYVGIGVITNPVPERKRVTIVLVLPGSPAESAGLQPHDSILAVDGTPILDKNGDRRVLLRGPAGSQITLTVQSPGQAPRQVPITRGQIDSEMPVPHQVLTSPQGKRIGYILLTTFDDETIPRKVRNALQEMRAGGRLDGLVLDNRHNEGGANTIFADVLAYFEDGKLGYFINRQEKDALQVDGRNIEGSQKLPLVVLVGPGTASFGEIFSGILKDTRRAYLIGQTTDGNVEILYVYKFSDGSRAWIAHDRFRPLNHPEQNWEETGIIPDSIVPSNWDETTIETDPTIQAALKHFDQ
jgi:carboxyl-terminal processing protease